MSETEPEGLGAPEPLGLSPVSEREREVLDAAIEGLSARDIAQRLSLSEATVRSHLSTVVVLEVHNEGDAIRPEDLPRLFDRFYRADRTREPGRHAGLGLAIVKAIVEASGGSISASSDPTGTRFTIRLPMVGGLTSQHPLSPDAVQSQVRRI